ncbi:MAG: ribbon-helix-helix domain-containing protein [bacterium]
MKVKTSITLSEDLLRALDQRSRSGRYKNRSEFIETAVRSFIAEAIRNEQNARDLEIINRHADELNEEAEDVLFYQIPLDGGYQPIREGYQPREKQGYTPTSGSSSNSPPKPPKGGTGQSSGKN